jgi:hypothetical protein
MRVKPYGYSYGLDGCGWQTEWASQSASAMSWATRKAQIQYLHSYLE